MFQVVANGEMYDGSYPCLPSPIHTPLRELSMSFVNAANKDQKTDVKIFDRSQFRNCSIIDEGDKSISKQDTVLNSIESPYMKKLFYPDDDKESEIMLPSMSSVTVCSSPLIPRKKRNRSSIESNCEMEIASKDTFDASSWKSPFKKLKLKDSFRFKTKERPYVVKNNTKIKEKKVDNLNFSNCTSSTISPEKDDHNESLCSLAKNDKSFFSSSGIFDISFCSLRQSKTMKSMSKLRRSMKSITSSFRGERKKTYERKVTDFDEVDDCFDNFDNADSLMSDATLNNKNGVNAKENDDSKLSPVIFKTPKKKSKIKRHRHTLCETSPAFSSPVNPKVNPMHDRTVGTACERSYGPQSMIRNPDARFNTNAKSSLDCSMLSVLTCLLVFVLFRFSFFYIKFITCFTLFKAYYHLVQISGGFHACNHFFIYIVANLSFSLLKPPPTKLFFNAALKFFLIQYTVSFIF